MIHIIDTIEKFESLKGEWERLEQNPEMRIFQTYTWCRTAWDDYLSKEENNRLWILEWCQEGKEDIVIFPFYIDGKDVLRFIMDTHSDACDSVHSKENLNRYWAYKEAADAILENKNIASVFLQKLPGGCESLGYFSIFLSGSVTIRDNAFSLLPSPQTDSFISGQLQLKRKDRDRLKAIARKSGGMQFRIISAGKGDVFPLSSIRELRENMLSHCRKDVGFLSDSMISFVEKIYSAGKCEIPVLSDASGIHALAFRLMSGSHINYWVVEYDNQRLVTELYLKYMEEKAKEGSWVFDFGVGVYGYKLGTYRPIVNVTFSIRYANSLMRQLRGLVAANLRLLKDIVKPRRKR